MAQSFVSFIPQPIQGQFPKLSFQDLMKERPITAGTPAVIMEHGGELSKMAMAMIERSYEAEIRRGRNEGLSAVVDVRVHRLFPGQFAEIPGWHCDGVPRDMHYGEPNFKAIHPLAFHASVILSDQPGGVSNIEFVNATIKPQLSGRTQIYKEMHYVIEKSNLPTMKTRDGLLVRYSPKTILRELPAHHRGWRFYLRFSMVEKPPIENMINGGQQVYILSESNGW